MRHIDITDYIKANHWLIRDDGEHLHISAVLKGYVYYFSVSPSGHVGLPLRASRKDFTVRLSDHQWSAAIYLNDDRCWTGVDLGTGERTTCDSMHEVLVSIGLAQEDS